MKRILLFIIIGLMFVTSNGFSQSDVFIDSTGNTYTGVSNPWSKFQVDGETDRDAIEGMAVGNGVGIYGGNTTFNYYGILGAPSAGVYGYSATGNAGLFDGNVQINGNLTLTGTLTGYSETDPIFSGSPSFDITAADIANWDASYGWGDHSLIGYDVTDDSWAGTGDISMTSGNVGIGMSAPLYRLDVAGEVNLNSGIPSGIALRVNGDEALWYNGSYFSWGFGGTANYFADDVGIGTAFPSEKLTVVGTIESTSGGIKFPDGTVQETASSPSWHQVLPAAERFVLVMGGVAVLDKETGLVWEQSPSTAFWNWLQATLICANSNVGGRMGWHLPTIEQLASLVDRSVTGSPKLPSGHPFSNVQSARYWSASKHPSDPNDVWGLHFGSGNVDLEHRDSTIIYTWCVRGGQSNDGY